MHSIQTLVGMGVTKWLAVSTAGEEAETERTMRGKCSLLMEPISYFRNLQTAASNLLHQAKAYFGADMVKASTIWVKRYWYWASVPSMSASVFCKAVWLNSTMELSPKL
jgi:hypothetical protein